MDPMEMNNPEFDEDWMGSGRFVMHECIGNTSKLC